MLSITLKKKSNLQCNIKIKRFIIIYILSSAIKSKTLREHIFYLHCNVKLNVILPKLLQLMIDICNNDTGQNGRDDNC